MYKITMHTKLHIITAKGRFYSEDGVSTLYYGLEGSYIIECNSVPYTLLLGDTFFQHCMAPPPGLCRIYAVLNGCSTHSTWPVYDGVYWVSWWTCPDLSVWRIV